MSPGHGAGIVPSSACLGRNALAFALAADDRFYPGLELAAVSMLHELRDCPRVSLHIIDGGLGEARRNCLETHVFRVAHAKRVDVSVNWLAIDEGVFEGLPKIWGQSFLTYTRIMLPDIIELDEVVWLDADIIFFENMSGFGPATKDNGSFLIGGTVDEWIRTVGNDNPTGHRDLDAFPYINCGVLWMNLKRWRQERWGLRMMDRMQAWKDKLHLWDQTALNAVCAGQVHFSDARYNRLAGLNENRAISVWDGCGNLHYVSRRKPWLAPVEPLTSCRDLVYWKAREIYLNEDRREEVARCVQAIRKAERLPAFWLKFWAYSMLNPGKARKWRGRIPVRGAARRLLDLMARHSEAYESATAGVRTS